MRLPVVALVALVAFAPRAAAQSSPVLRDAMQLASVGRSDSARQIVAGVLARARAGDTLYVEALYCRGRLAGSADSAERDLRRVAIEFSTSRWAPDAMLRLAQLAMTNGNSTGALGYAQRLRGDYPDSPLRPQAALWGGRAAFDAGRPLAACALLDSARAEAAGDIEFQNQVGFFRGRCTSVTLAPPPPQAAETSRAAPPANAADSAKAPPRAPSAPVADTMRPPAAAAPQLAAPEGPYEVQVAAPRSEAAAREIADRFTRAGYAARVVSGPGGYFRVRLGPYATLRAAQDAALSARRLVRERPFVVRR